MILFAAVTIRSKPMPEPKKLMIAGDWHGNIGWAVDVVDHAAEQGCDTILQLGDFGYWTDTPPTAHYLRSLTGALTRTGITLYWIDGNHEDFSRRSEWAPPGNDTLNPIVHLPRGYRWEWWGKTWMAVGGGVSMDRHWRVRDESWWVEETLTEEQIEWCCRPGGVDVIVSHDCPRGVDIPGIGPSTKGFGWPYDVLVDAEEHRGKLRRVWDATGASELYHGHYHVWYQAHLNGGTVVGLDRDDSSLHDNTLILSAEEQAHA
jgi:hypothetical protein